MPILASSTLTGRSSMCQNTHTQLTDGTSCAYATIWKGRSRFVLSDNKEVGDDWPAAGATRKGLLSPAFGAVLVFLGRWHRSRSLEPPCLGQLTNFKEKGWMWLKLSTEPTQRGHCLSVFVCRLPASLVISTREW